MIQTSSNRCIGPADISGIWISPRKQGGSPPSGWTPADVSADTYAWHTATNVTESAGDATYIFDQGPNGYDISCAYIDIVPGGPFTYNAASLNGLPTLEYKSIITGGQFAYVSSGVSTQFMGLDQPFTIGYVGRMVTLATDEYTSTGVMAGTNDDDSATMYYLNTDSAFSAFNQFYFQVGNSFSPLGHCVIIGPPVTDVIDFTEWHQWLLTYNGGGDFENAANWSLRINGVDRTVTIYTNAGGNAPFSCLGNHGDLPDVAPGDFAEQLWCQIAFDETTKDNWDAYVAERWGIGAMLAKPPQNEVTALPLSNRFKITKTQALIVLGAGALAALGLWLGGLVF